MIQQTPGTEPIWLPPYRISYAYRDEVLKQLQEMEECGIIALTRMVYFGWGAVSKILVVPSAADTP